MRKLLSLCMIVKDEEAVLGRCLDSVKDWVDEIIIVDTGSTDGTKEIARQYTDKVYDFQWINDFSAARNESLKHATGTWILVMDADEYFEETEIRNLRQILSAKEPKPNVVLNVTIVSFMGSKFNQTASEGAVSRVFANHMGIRYVRPIHEQPKNINGKPMKAEQLPVRIMHTGYDEESLKNKNKHQRNLSIFQALEQKEGLTAYDHLLLANQYLMMQEYERAAPHLQMALKHPDELGETYRQALFANLQLCINTGKFLDGYLFYEKSLGPYAHYPDMLTIKGLLLKQLGFADMAQQTFLQALQEADRRAAKGEALALVSIDIATRLPLLQMALLHAEQEDFQQAISYLTKLLMAIPGDVQALTLLLQWLALKESAPAIIGFVSKLIRPEHNRLLTVMLCKIAIRIGHQELAEYYAGHLDMLDRLDLGDRLRYYLLTRQKPEFDRLMQETGAKDSLPASAVQVMIAGALVWNRPEWLDMIRQDEQEEKNDARAWAKRLMEGAEDPNHQPRLMADLLRTLYLTGHTEVYDEWIDQISSPEIVNELAQFFYTRYQTELAELYLSHLVQNQAVTGENWVHLASLFTLRGAMEDAAYALENAIEAFPDRHELYIRYCQVASGEKRKTMLQRLYEKEPKFRQLSLLR